MKQTLNTKMARDTETVRNRFGVEAVLVEMWEGYVRLRVVASPLREEIGQIWRVSFDNFRLEWA